jgi:hypothetical protein
MPVYACLISASIACIEESDDSLNRLILRCRRAVCAFHCEAMDLGGECLQLSRSEQGGNAVCEACTSSRSCLPSAVSTTTHRTIPAPAVGQSKPGTNGELQRRRLSDSFGDWSATSNAILESRVNPGKSRSASSSQTLSSCHPPRGTDSWREDNAPSPRSIPATSGLPTKRP